MNVEEFEFGEFGKAVAEIIDGLKANGPAVDFEKVVGFIDGELGEADRLEVARSISSFRDWYSTYWETLFALRQGALDLTENAERSFSAGESRIFAPVVLTPVLVASESLGVRRHGAGEIPDECVLVLPSGIGQAVPNAIRTEFFPAETTTIQLFLRGIPTDKQGLFEPQLELRPGPAHQGLCAAVGFADGSVRQFYWRTRSGARMSPFSDVVDPLVLRSFPKGGDVVSVVFIGARPTT